eukprot:119828-Pleurochrysis_carterae.AAC.1
MQQAGSRAMHKAAEHHRTCRAAQTGTRIDCRRPKAAAETTRDAVESAARFSLLANARHACWHSTKNTACRFASSRTILAHDDAIT